MRIMHLLQSSKFSGAESVVCQIIEAFQNDDDIEMFYVSQVGEIESVLKKRGIHYYLLNSFTQKEIDKAVKEIKPHIIHAHDFNASVRAAKYKQCSIISHIHNNPLWFSKIDPRTLIYGLSIKKYAKIIGVSSSILNEFILSKRMEKKFVLLPNVVSKESVLEKSNEACDVSADVLFVGRLAQAKDPLLFLEIINEIVKSQSNIKALMIGEGELREECEAYISKNNLEKNVKLQGFEPNPYKYMKNSKMLVMTSIYEGFGLVAVEAMILGVPVICRGIGGLVDIVDNETGYLCNSIESYCIAITNLLDNSKERFQKGALSQNKADKFCNLKLYKKQLIDIYKSM